MFTQVDQNEVFLVTETLTRFVLVGEAATPSISKPVKHLKLAVFGASPSQSTTLLEYSVRVYVIEDTKSSLEVSAVDDSNDFLFLTSDLKLKAIVRIKNFNES